MSASLIISIPEWLDRVCAWPVLIYRLWKYGYTYRRIYIGEGKFTIVDLGDYYWLNKYNWCLWDNGCNKYARTILYDAKIGTRTISMHREIIRLGAGLLVDHRNGDGLDNRRENLRPATRAENCYNKRKTRTKTSSRFIGVCFDKQTNKWRAYIRYDGKRIWIGRYDSEIEAAKAHDIEAKKHHGEFARLNFSDTDGHGLKH
jgi:hypothetical protein